MADAEKIYNVLFLCTGNSARSILAECILNRLGQGRFDGYSAGSFPAGAVNPFALALLMQHEYKTDDLRSKRWDEFGTADAPAMDFVFTVCDNAAGEVCPVWPGHPVTAHWPFPDPAAVEGTDAEKRTAFAETYDMIERRLESFVNLPVDRLDELTLKNRLDEIGQTDPAGVS